jgi:peptide-methionine (R)-S-oxide reductase
MRFNPFFSTILYTISNFTRPRTAAFNQIFARPIPLRASMPTIPFLSALFGSSSSSNNMSYPDQRSPDEWRAQLNRGE